MTCLGAKSYKHTFYTITITINADCGCELVWSDLSSDRVGSMPRASSALPVAQKKHTLWETMRTIHYRMLLRKGSGAPITSAELLPISVIDLLA